jgi:hypothetical protein
MMMKGFSGVEMKLAGKHHAHDQGVNPEFEPMFAPASHSTDLAPPLGSIANACPSLK